MSDLNQRIEAMYKRDVLIASMAPPGPWRIVLLIGGAAVLLFNTASIGALVRHYKEDKQFIYGLDIKHLDEMRGHKH